MTPSQRDGRHASLAESPFTVTVRSPATGQCDCERSCMLTSAERHRAKVRCRYRGGAVRPKGWYVSYREAFATLEEAQHAADERVVVGYNRDRLEDWEVPPRYYTDSYEARNLPASGGSIRLPNGDVIEVEATTYIDLWNACGEPSFDDKAEILAAWNAEHGIGIGELA